MLNFKESGGLFSFASQNVGSLISGTADSFDQANKNRFVAGNKFFNYQQFGALRDGGSVRLFSSSYIGLVAATFASSFIYAILRYCLRPTLMDFLEVQRSESTAVTECLLSLPTSFALFAGLCSDMRPIAGYHRKSYMVVGCVLSFIMCLGLAVLSATVEPSEQSGSDLTQYISYYMVLVMGGTFGTMVTSVAVQARVIELSQREPLTMRGSLQIDYLIFRTTVEALAMWLTYSLTTYKDETGNYHLKVEPFLAYAGLAVVALLPIPFMVRNCSERSELELAADEALMASIVTSTNVPPELIAQSRASGLDGVRAFFRMCQQRAVWQIVLFLSILLAFTRFYFGAANSGLSSLASLDKNVSLRSSAIAYFAVLGVMILWKLFWPNSSWRICVVASIAISIGLKMTRAFLILYVPSLRGQTLYDLVGCLLGVTDGLITIFSLIPATEIAENGSEGATIGLLIAARSILAVAVRTLCSQWLNSAVTYTESDGVDRLCMLLLVSYAIQALSLLSVLLLPRQKLDAQQMRVYGGYNRTASVVLLVVFAVLFTFSTGMNLKAMISMTQGYN